MAVARERNPKRARARTRWDSNDILYPGALTSRKRRYAAEPAPDGDNLTSMSERSANNRRNSAVPPIFKCRAVEPQHRGFRLYSGPAVVVRPDCHLSSPACRPCLPQTTASRKPVSLRERSPRSIREPSAERRHVQRKQSEISASQSRDGVMAGSSLHVPW